MLRLLVPLVVSLPLSFIVGCPGSAAEGEGEGEGAGEGEGEGAAGEGEGEGEGGAGEGEGEGEGGAGEGEGEGEGGGAAWTTLTLTDSANNTHDQDDVSAIYFESTTVGYIGTMGNPGAVWKSTATTLGDFAFPDTDLSSVVGLLGDAGVMGIVPTTDGITVTLDSCSGAITTTNDFTSVTSIDTNLGNDYGIAAMSGLFETPANGYVALIGSGVVTRSATAPGVSTVWGETWAPEGVPTNPNPIPVGGCEVGPRDRRVENKYQIGSMSPDGNTVIYAGRSKDVALIYAVCVSNDGGATFQSKDLPGLDPDNSDQVGPSVALMTSNTVGFTAVGDFPFTSTTGGHSMIFKTTDGGLTWNPTTLPALATGHVVQYATIFFAPDGTHGWAGGQIDSGGAFLLKTTDAGDTWTAVGALGEFQAAMDAAPPFGTFGRIYTGFALDNNNIWVGGDHGTVFYSSTGGN